MSLLARLSFGFIVGILTGLLVLQGTVWLLGQLSLAPVVLFPMRINLPWPLAGLMQQSVIGGLWGALFVLLWDRWGRAGVVASAGFGALFGLIGPAMVLWILWPALRGGALFGGGSVGRIAVGALTAALFGVGLAWLTQIVNGYMRHASR
jgi:hypothetical protein